MVSITTWGPGEEPKTVTHTEGDPDAEQAKERALEWATRQLEPLLKMKRWTEADWEREMVKA